VVFAGTSALNTAIAFVRSGTGLNLKDLQGWLNKLPWNPWISFLTIVCMALTALLIAVFHETKNIVEQRITGQMQATRKLAEAQSHALAQQRESLEAERSAHSSELAKHQAEIGRLNGELQRERENLKNYRLKPVDSFATESRMCG